MDRFIASLPAQPDGDLMLCRDEGIAYQADRSSLVNYDAAYYEKCAGHPQEIADRINAGRIGFVRKHFGDGKAVDVGIGSGEFIRRRGNTYGHDVNPAGIEWLKRNDLWVDKIAGFGAATFWDVIEPGGRVWLRVSTRWLANELIPTSETALMSTIIAAGRIV